MDQNNQPTTNEMQTVLGNSQEAESQEAPKPNEGETPTPEAEATPAEGEPTGEQTEGETPAEGEQPAEGDGKIDYENIDEAEIFEGLNVAEDYQVGLDKENPAYKWWLDYAQKNDIPKEEFIGGIQSFVQHQLANVPDPAQEIAKLGDDGQNFVNQVDHWLAETLKNHYGASEDGRRQAQEHYEALAQTVVTAEGIKALNALREISLDTGVPANPGGRAGTADPMTMDKVRDMMKDPRYRDPMKRDPDYVEQVRKATEAAVKAGQ